MKRITTALLLCLMVCTSGHCYTKTVDGVTYDIEDGKAEVVEREDGKKYSGTVVIRGYVDGCPVTEISCMAFIDCSGITSIEFPNSGIDMIIQEGSFTGCTGLTTITFPEGITSMGGFTVLQDCTRLKSVFLPSTIKYFDIDAFWGCTNLRDIYLKAQTPPKVDLGVVGIVGPTNVTAKYLRGLYANVTVHVPADSYNLYKKHRDWKKFRNIVTLEGTTPPVTKSTTTKHSSKKTTKHKK